MKKIIPALALSSLALVSIAQAHTHLGKSMPANNSVVSELPKNVMLSFNEATQLSLLTLQKGDGKPQDLGPLPKSAVKEVAVPMPAVDAGSYIIKWSAVGDDGHVMSGKVMFKVTAPGAAIGK